MLNQGCLTQPNVYPSSQCIIQTGNMNREAVSEHGSHGQQAKPLGWHDLGGLTFCCEINLMPLSTDQYGTEPGQTGRRRTGPR